MNHTQPYEGSYSESPLRHPNGELDLGTLSLILGELHEKRIPLSRRVRVTYKMRTPSFQRGIMDGNYNFDDPKYYDHPVFFTRRGLEKLYELVYEEPYSPHTEEERTLQEGQMATNRRNEAAIGFHTRALIQENRSRKTKRKKRLKLPLMKIDEAV